MAKRFLWMAGLYSTAMVLWSSPVVADGRGSAGGGGAHKLEGPGPFWVLQVSAGVPLRCLAGRCSDWDTPEVAATYRWWWPRWVDATLTYQDAVSRWPSQSQVDSGEVSGLEPEAVDVNSLGAEFSAEWAFMRRADRDVAWYKRFFWSLGFGWTNYHGDNFSSFTRPAFLAKIGFRLPFLDNRIRIGTGARIFPTAFTYEEFGAAPNNDDNFVPMFAFVEFTIFEP